MEIQPVGMHMHRNIKAVVRASDVETAVARAVTGLETAVARAVTGLETAMDNDILPDGTVRTLGGEYDATPLDPSTYFQDDREQAGYRANTEDGRKDLATAWKHTEEHHNAFIYSIDEREDGPTATPIVSDDAYTRLLDALETKDDPHWVIAFDLRYDFDATPHKPHEIL